MISDRSKRKFFRLAVRPGNDVGMVAHLKPLDIDADAADFRVHNISQAGMFIATDNQWPIGTKFEFRLVLEDAAIIEGMAEVRWLRQRGVHDLAPAGMGAQFESIVEGGRRAYFQYIEQRLVDLQVADLMTAEILGLTRDLSVRDAVALMNANNVGSVVIVDASGRLEGIFTERDFLRLGTEPGFLEMPLDSAMTERPLHVGPEALAQEAYEILKYKPFRHLPVVRGVEVVGMISTRDLFPYWQELLDLQARRLSSDHGRAVSLIVHDLRSPIGVVKTVNALNLLPDLDKETFEELSGAQIINTNCDMMLSLIDQLLEVWRGRLGDVELRKQDLELDTIVTQAAAFYQLSAAKKSIVFETDIEPLARRVSADSLRIQQILHNLISNAVKYSPANSRIVVGLKDEGEKVKFWVSDTGPGILQEEVPKLFREFTRISNKPTGGESSTGLGLAITKVLAEAHGGEIKVKTAVGVGTTFEVFLPY